MSLEQVEPYGQKVSEAKVDGANAAKPSNFQTQDERVNQLGHHPSDINNNDPRGSVCPN